MAGFAPYKMRAAAHIAALHGRLYVFGGSRYEEGEGYVDFNPRVDVR